ncbi:MAG: mechanosensitive ion channel [Saccharospirillaceae bacterium]|nr:mechanosensitive ion channel protein MscS [Thalassolituus sp. HI0120]MCH2041240.1 mechanosensitive ion channel [Saccharospirillaceae bacterium]
MKDYLQNLDSDALLQMTLPLATNLIIALAIYVIGRWLVKRLIKLTAVIMSRRKLDEALVEFITSIASVLLSFVVALIALEQLGIDTTSLMALLGAAGLAIGLALKDSLSNFAAGVMLILFKPFRLGDFVEAGGVAGVVEKISVFSTQFRTGDNREIIVPNSGIYGGVITNYSAKATRRIDLTIGIGYDDDIKKAREVLQHILQQDNRILAEPEPVIAVAELADSSVNFAVRPWVHSADYWAVQWDLLETIKLTFDEKGISIPYPQQDIHLRKPNE